MAIAAYMQRCLGHKHPVKSRYNKGKQQIPTECGTAGCNRSVGGKCPIFSPLTQCGQQYTQVTHTTQMLLPFIPTICCSVASRALCNTPFSCVPPETEPEAYTPTPSGHSPRHSWLRLVDGMKSSIIFAPSTQHGQNYPHLTGIPHRLVFD